MSQSWLSMYAPVIRLTWIVEGIDTERPQLSKKKWRNIVVAVR